MPENASSSQPVIVADSLVRSFDGRRALDGAGFTADAGEVVALLGPNGAGKTTAVRILNGVLKLEGGSARVLGLDPTTQGEEVRRRTGVVTEGSAVDERLTARENVLVHGRIRQVPDALLQKRTDEMLERFGIAHRANHLVQGFSTGQRKRVALARALVHDPEVLFLDEPTSGLDPESTREVLDLVDHLAREQGRTVLLCTHFLGEAGRLCRRMAVLRDGRTLAFGEPESIALGLQTGLLVEVQLDLASVDDNVITQFCGFSGVTNVQRSELGLDIRVDDRSQVPELIRALSASSVEIFGVTPRPPTMEDVYFAVTRAVSDAP